MVKIITNLSPQENEVLDDIADLVREERRRRFKVSDRSLKSKGTIGFHEMNIRQLNRISEDPHYVLLRPIYKELIKLGKNIIKSNL